MEYRRLGRTDIEVSVICLGTMTFGKQNTEAEGHAQMDFAVDHGVNFFDVAEMYSSPPSEETCGRSEEILGTWFKASGKRDKVVLATKAVGPGTRFPYIRDGNPKFNRTHLEAAVEGSLKKLQTDVIDVYQLHWPERQANYFGKRGYVHGADQNWTPIEETLSVLKDLVDAGKIRAVGLSNETPWGMMKFADIADRMGLPRAVSVQNPYNLLNRLYEVGCAEVSIREEMGLLAYSPLAGGYLSGKYIGGAKPEGARMTLFADNFSRYLKPHADEAIEAYVGIARDHGLDPSQMALAYVNSRDFVTSNIIGATRLDQLAANIASADITLSEEVLEAIETVQTSYPDPCP